MRKTGHAHQDEGAHLRQVAGGEPDADLAAERVSDENHRSLDPIEQVLLDQIGVVNGVPVGGRRRCLTEPGQIDQMNAMRVLEERGDAAQAVAAAAPAMQEHDDGASRRPDDFVDRGCRSVVLEAFDGDECTSHDEGRSVSRRYGVSECGSHVSDGDRDSQPLVR